MATRGWMREQTDKTVHADPRRIPPSPGADDTHGHCITPSSSNTTPHPAPFQRCPPICTCNLPFPEGNDVDHPLTAHSTSSPLLTLIGPLPALGSLLFCFCCCSAEVGRRGWPRRRRRTDGVHRDADPGQGTQGPRDTHPETPPRHEAFPPSTPSISPRVAPTGIPPAVFHAPF